MSPTTQRMIPENYSAADLTDMPKFTDITPELIDYYVRKGKEMRSRLIMETMYRGWRALLGAPSALFHRLFGVGGHLGAQR